MNAIFPTSRAEAVCRAWMKELTPDGPENGCMLGVLVCTDGTVLKAFSGMHKELMGRSDFVPPCFDIAEFEKNSSDWPALMKTYRFHCIDHSIHSLDELFPDAPSGAGDCCAPRLLCRCFELGKMPLSMAEFFWGDSPYERGSFHTPCDARCKPLLKHILGLDIVYADEDIVVVNKPHGLLAIEGKTEKDCVASRVRALYHNCIAQPCVHRLDQGTGGLMVLGTSQKAHDVLSADFENRRVGKTYTALVDGVLRDEEGTVELKMRPDLENRPYQIVSEDGKNSVTRYRRARIEKVDGCFVTRLELYPETGRTHQIRVHCAFGLGMPVLGDPLYGKGGEKLCLYATGLEFTHPISGKRMDFTVQPDF